MKDISASEKLTLKSSTDNRFINLRKQLSFANICSDNNTITVTENVAENVEINREEPLKKEVQVNLNASFGGKFSQFGYRIH